MENTNNQNYVEVVVNGFIMYLEEEKFNMLLAGEITWEEIFG